ncbi:MAG TPA: aminotransferase class IV [Polyangiaceae bacterium]|nr:aminotransferase class IV [Polyangiaceae bacterium]
MSDTKVSGQRSSTPPARSVWIDGALVPWIEARTSVLCHAMQRGSLVFDVAALHETAGGTVACFRARDHIGRFLRSAALVGLDVRWDKQTLLVATIRTARESGLSKALVRWSAYIPTLEPDVVPRPSARASVVIAVLGPADAEVRGVPATPKPETVNVAMPRDTRKAGPEVLPPQAKVAAAYLGPCLAKRRARSYGYDEIVLLDREGRVAEAPTANVFAVLDGVLVSPPPERVLAGITRASVLEIARALGIATREAHIKPDELAGSDEAFLTATSLPIQAIASVDGHAMRAGAPGPVTTRLKEALLACTRGADPRFLHWLDPIA